MNNLFSVLNYSMPRPPLKLPVCMHLRHSLQKQKNLFQRIWSRKGPLPGLTEQFSAAEPSVPTSRCSSWSCRRRRQSGRGSEPSSGCWSQTTDSCDPQRPELRDKQNLEQKCRKRFLLFNMRICRFKFKFDYYLKV